MALTGVVLGPAGGAAGPAGRTSACGAAAAGAVGGGGAVCVGVADTAVSTGNSGTLARGACAIISGAACLLFISAKGLFDTFFGIFGVGFTGAAAAAGAGSTGGGGASMLRVVSVLAPAASRSGPLPSWAGAARSTSTWASTTSSTSTVRARHPGCPRGCRFALFMPQCSPNHQTVAEQRLSAAWPPRRASWCQKY